MIRRRTEWDTARSPPGQPEPRAQNPHLHLSPARRLVARLPRRPLHRDRHRHLPDRLLAVRTLPQALPRLPPRPARGNAPPPASCLFQVTSDTCARRPSTSPPADCSNRPARTAAPPAAHARVHRGTVRCASTPPSMASACRAQRASLQFYMSHRGCVARLPALCRNPAGSHSVCTISGRSPWESGNSSPPPC